jgi:2-polyprenyl-6-methoxyphenol hydroxylase-like FAD-dependent oxidoreductase
MSSFEKVAIIGGGIGGLTLANALHHHDIPFDLYEQSPELTEVGAGIGLSEAPIRILDEMDLGNMLRKQGSRVREVYMPDKNLKVRRHITVNSEMVCIHRARLIDILKSRLPKTSIHLNKKAVSIQAGENQNTVTFEDGQSITSKCTAAADGINSELRRQIFPEIKVRYINQTIWRGISEAPMPQNFGPAYLEIWDEGLRFLVIHINDSEIFWLGVKPEEPGGKDNPDTVREDLLKLYQNFHPELKELIRTSKNVLRSDMADLGTAHRPWFKSRLVFIGDAIHATTPNFAQGGCQSIEDAWCLAKCLKKFGSDYSTAFETYQGLRETKVMKIVKDSWTFGKAAHSGNPLFHYGYRLLLTKAPEFVLRKQEAFLNDMSYLDGIV